MSTVAMPIEQIDIEQLRVAVEKAGNSLGDMRTRCLRIDDEIDEITAAVRTGAPGRASEIPALLMEQSELQRAIGEQEAELSRLQAALQRAKDKTDRATLEAVFSEMRSTRTEIITLAQQMSLLLGKLHSELLKRGERLVPHVVGDLRQQEFCRLLEPIDPFTGAWMGRHKDVVVEFQHIVRVRPMKSL